MLADGTVSDGKVDTYARCVEALCGPADTFLTSVFSAQGKRQLSTYRNAEIKTLLADLLGQEEIRVIGQKASETARLLKAGLVAIRQEASGLDVERDRLAAERLLLDGATSRVVQAVAALRTAQSALEAGQARHTTVVAERDQSMATETRRAQLHAERRSLLDRGTESNQALQGRERSEGQSLQALEQRITQRRAQATARWQTLQQSRRQCLAALALSGLVGRAVRRQPLAERLLALRGARMAACRQQVQRLAQCQAAGQLAEQKLQGIDREAGKAALRAEELAHRFGLTREVPCAGTALQGQCKLLGDAREAQSLTPSANRQIAALARQKAQVQSELVVIRQQRDALQDAPQRLKHAERCEEAARSRASRIAVLVAKAAEVARAESMLATVDQELAALDVSAAGSSSPETADEQAERQRIAAARLELGDELKRHAQRVQEGLGRIDGLLAALPAPFDERRLAATAQAVADSRQAVATAERAHLAVVRDAQALEGLSRQMQALADRRVQVDARVAHVETELGGWNLFARCMSNDGLIALAIDDAGPTLSGLANDLLLACYGPRFTVSIHTLVETGKGEQREGFDIVVHDGESGESKSVGLMSGGERVWINECLTRAVALYLAQHSGRRYTTLFSDEADGALDPDRKRMFMAMKREVLRLGGYEREFFVSQTPELTAMADAVIDLDALQASASAPPANAVA
ncbi:MAG: DNA repair protein [Burkholderiaceae bacterium]|nr:DNA repair protein [Burkholderiaceae bacterium]